jgi:hypothetical protein
MDLSALDDTAFSSRVAIESIKKARINLDRTVVLLRVYVGATRQDEPFRLGIAEAKDELREQGIFLEYEIFTSDYVKTSLRWTVSQLIDWLLLADVHMIPCHVHEGSIGKTDSWNMKNIQSNIRRLRFHPGVPMGKHVECAIFNQDKYLMYVKSHPLSADVLQIPLELNLLENEEHLAKIRA